MMRADTVWKPISMPQSEQSLPHAQSVSQIRVQTLGTSPAETALWQGYVERGDGATIYHHIAWRRIYRRAFGYRSFMLMAVDGQDCVRGVLPLFHVPSVLGAGKLTSVPFRDRGGILFEGREAFLALVTVARSVAAGLGGVAIELKALSAYPVELAQEAGLCRREYWINSVVDLADLTPEKLMASLGVKARMIRQGERAGLYFTEGTAADLNEWMVLHRGLQRELGIPAFPQDFFQSLFDELGLHVRLFMVRGKDGLAAAVIAYLENDRLIYAYSASTAAGRAKRANDVLLGALMKWAMARGLRWFDFGSDSPKQDGLLTFKRKWLSRQQAIPTYWLGDTPPNLRDSSEARYLWPRAVIRNLPPVLGHGLLAPMIKYLG